MASQAAWLSLDPPHGRWLPGALGDLLLWSVETHRQLEAPVLRCRQPVPLLGGAGRIALNVDRQRAVGIARQIAAVAEGIAVEGIVDKVRVLVVEGDRPERLDGWS